MSEIAEQIVALPGWQWLPGMCAVSPSGRTAYLQPVGGASGVCGAPADGWLPVLADPATGGAMLDLLERSLTISLQSVRGQGWLVAAWGEAGRPCCVGAAPSIGEAVARVAMSLGRWA